MSRGGARPRSGPPADPNSRTSERRRRAAAATSGAGQITLSEFDPMALPASGRGGNPPAFPLPKISRHVVELVDGKPVKTPSVAASEAFRKRELAIWREVWKTPQAFAWERETWRWPIIAAYCRMRAVTEAEPDASAALLSRERELRIECGLTADGLRMNGWAIAPDDLAKRRAEKAAAADAVDAADGQGKRQRRLR